MKFIKGLFYLNAFIFAVMAVFTAFFGYKLDAYDSTFTCVMTAILFLTWALEAK
jgi:hypothetical protein